MTATTMERLNAQDGHELRGYLAVPDGDGLAGGIVLSSRDLWHQQVLKKTSPRSSPRPGYLAIVPDLFARQERDVELGYTGDDFTHAIALRDALDWDTVVSTYSAAVNRLRTHPRSNGRVAALGYCLRRRPRGESRRRDRC